jgi:flagellar hook-associated protein 2
MALERAPLIRLETEKDDLEVKKSIYSDIKTKLDKLRTSIQDLTGDSGSLNSYSARVVDEDVLSASVLSSSSITTSQFDVTVNNLAVAEQYTSAQQIHSNVALGKTGDLDVGGGGLRSVTGAGANGVTGFMVNSNTDAIREGQTELGDGTYTVETRKDESGTWQFRVVDQNGDAVSIDDASDTGTSMTSYWQDLSNVAGTTFDTARGLQITFDSDFNNYLSTANEVVSVAASVDYVAPGDKITVSATDSLIDIRDAINNATYASGNEIVASVIDDKLILTAKNTGTQSGVNFVDGVGLGFALNTPAEDASLTVNGVTMTRSKNTGLNDVIAGLSLDLTSEDTTRISVAKDDSDVTEKVNTMLESLNDVLKHLKLKTEPQLDDAANDDKPTYKPAPLGRDSTMRSLRFDLSSDLLSIFSGATAGDPNDISDIGITVNSEDFTFSLTDSGDLKSALDDDFDAVKGLLDHVLGKMESRIDTYLDGTSAYITVATDDLDDRMDLLDTRIDSYEDRLNAREQALRLQYYELQGQLLEMQYGFQQTQAAMGSLNMYG